MAAAPQQITAQINEITRQIIGAAMKVHTALGPGLLESAYRACMLHELRKQGIRVESEVGLPVIYEGEKIDLGYRIDLIVAGSVIVEIKCVEAINPVHKSQLLSYMRLSGRQVGLLINFHVEHLRDGIKRMVDGYGWEKSLPQRTLSHTEERHRGFDGSVDFLCVTPCPLWSRFEFMFSGSIAQALVRGIDRLAPRRTTQDKTPAHLVTGRRGEEEAYFFLRKKGYVIIARNFRTARHRGEIDLIGWDEDVLCFVEVKTRTTHDVKPAEAAVDRKKRRDLRVMIRYYLRTLPKKQFPTLPQWRFDIVTVYYEMKTSRSSEEISNPLLPKSGRIGTPHDSSVNYAVPTFELFQNVALSS